jgi:PAS domain S-box-containing protein
LIYIPWLYYKRSAALSMANLNPRISSAVEVAVRRSRILLQASLVVAYFAGIIPADSFRINTGAKELKKILILYSFDKEETLYDGVDHAIRSTLNTAVPDRLEFHTEYLDLVRFPDARHQENMANLLKMRFSGQRLDLIICVSPSGLEFLRGAGKDLFPGTPIVARFTVNGPSEAQREMGKLPGSENITGVASRDDGPEKTLQLALTLQPDTQEVAIVIGTSTVEKFWLQEIQESFNSYQGKIRITYLTNLSMEETLKSVARLPRHTIILYPFFFRDATGQFFVSMEALDSIASSATVPIYGIYLPYIGHGVVGGRMADTETVVDTVGQQARRILLGEKPAQIPMLSVDTSRDTLDWRQLQRWGISEKRVPADSLVLFRELSIWDRYRKYVVTALVLCSLEAGLIVLLLVQWTRRKRAEESVRSSEKEWSSFVGSSPYGFCRTNINEDRFIAVNPALVEMLGYRSEKEIMGLSLSREVYFELGMRAACMEQFGNSMSLHGVEVVWRRADGKPITVRLTGRRLSESGLDRDVLETMVEDITGEHHLREQLRQAQKMEAMGRLAGGVAHDFNNLLGVIIGYSELLMEGTASQSPSRASIEAIKNAGDRAASLTAQLLAFSRNQISHPKVLSVNSMVSETVCMLSRLLREDIRPVIRLDTKLGSVKADPGQIVQVIMNLAVNGRDAMPDGGTLTIETANWAFQEEATIDGVPVQHGQYVMLAVSDSGTGMDPQTRSRIFEPFFTTKHVGKGTGLGLATVYGIVHQNKGYIFVESELGKGSTFRIFWPRVEELAVAEQLESSPKERRQGSETLLLVEDDLELRKLLYENLIAKGYNVIAAANGADALQAAELYGDPIHLLLTDVIMPQMSGPELARWLTASRPGMKVLYMSGYTDDLLPEIPTSETHVALLQKPFRLEVLGRKLREMIDHSAQDEPLAVPASPEQEAADGD